MLKSKKKENQKIKEQYEYIKKSIIKAMATDKNDNELIDVEYYNNMFSIEYDKSNEAQRILLKREELNKISNIENNTNYGNDYEVWGRETHGGIITDSGNFIPYINPELKPITKTGYQGYSNIHDQSPFISDDYK